MRIKQNFYAIETIKWNPELKRHEYVELSDGSLWAAGRYKTKIRPEDLPKGFVYGRYYKRFGYMNANGIKDMKYIPCYINHSLKDDLLLISYGKPIELKPDTTDRLSALSRYNYDEFADGLCIISILKAAKKYSGYDIEPIKQQIHEKMLWLKEHEPECYDREVHSDEHEAQWWD